MKISLNQNQFFDDDGNPLNAGKIHVYYRDSDTPVNLYKISGDEFVQADNPVITSNDGRADSVFFNAAVVDVVVEKNDGEILDTFQLGFEVSAGETESTVDTIAELKNTSTDLGYIKVRGYNALGDCPERSYKWDASNTSQQDGGYIIGSNVDADGRWIMIWDSSEIPASVYGVFPGNEANIANFASFPDTVGSFAQPTAKVLRFGTGEWTTSVSINAQKRIVSFDYGAKFASCPSIVCAGVINNGNSGSFANIEYSSNARYKEIHSSWYVDKSKFFEQCASNYVSTVHIDSDLTSYTASAEISRKLVYIRNKSWVGSNINISGCKIYPYDGEISSKKFVVESSNEEDQSIRSKSGYITPSSLCLEKAVKADSSAASSSSFLRFVSGTLDLVSGDVKDCYNNGEMLIAEGNGSSFSVRFGGGDHIYLKTFEAYKAGIFIKINNKFHLVE